MKEKDVQIQIVEYLRLTGWVVFETNQPGLSHATPGLPDVIAVREARCRDCVTMHKIHNRTLWIEVKGPRGKMSDAQIKAKEDIEGQGGEFLEANSLDVVMDYLGGVRG